MTHNYSYNFGFLTQWFEANPHITRRQVLEALHINDYNTLRNWTEGKFSMPLQQILRFCNAFSVPLECFFFDHDVIASVNPPAPTANSMTEPAGGYKDKARGNNTPVNPLVDYAQESNLPYNKRTNEEDAITETEKIPVQQQTMQITDGTINMILQMQQISSDERQSYMRTIEKQNDIIKSLTEQINKRKDERRGYSFVAED